MKKNSFFKPHLSRAQMAFIAKFSCYALSMAALSMVIEYSRKGSISVGGAFELHENPVYDLSAKLLIGIGVSVWARYHANQIIDLDEISLSPKNR